ncbi:AbrB/MazE/SpoVT family DNA-binding domain-containing protein [Gammaproteobacteria bacterium]|nr:AbrB/MazE/SpoVT family DNA-binding domain-containing protein [Gammaproteobacteria bacterium]
MARIKVTSIGNSVGIVLPKEVLARLRVTKGDILYAVQTPNGVELRPYDSEFVEQVDAAEKIMRQDRDVLSKLAK